MDLYQTRYTIFEEESKIHRIVLKGINAWNKEHGHTHIDELSIYMPPLVRYAIDDWVSEYERLLDRRPDTSFAEYVKDQADTLLFHFRWSLTHKADTLFRQAYKQLWDAMSKDEQDAFLHGLRYLIDQSTN